MASSEPSKRSKRVKQTSQRPLKTSRPTTLDFDKIHFLFPQLATRFHTSLMDKLVTHSCYTDINDFTDITICGSTIRDILVQWEASLSINEKLFDNLVSVLLEHEIVRYPTKYDSNTCRWGSY